MGKLPTSVRLRPQLTLTSRVACLALLIFVASGAVVAGLLAGNAVFWAAASAIFLLACAPLAIYPAKVLAVYADTLEAVESLARHRARRPRNIQSPSDGNADEVG